MITIRIDDAAFKRAVNDPQLVAGPIKEFLAEASLLVQREAIERAPVDTGRLRGSISTELKPLQAIVGPSVTYAPYVELGTRPHWPPVNALQPWARRHGIPNAFVLARAIARRGTKPHPFMRPAADILSQQMPRFMAQLANAIRQRWGRQ